MKYCPECGESTAIFDVRHNHETTYRHRRCKSCGHTFFTIEFEAEDNEQLRKEWNRIARYKQNKETL